MAFRKLAKELHPDISKGNEERFKKVSSAYEIVGDPEKAQGLRPRRDRRARRPAPCRLPPVRAWSASRRRRRCRTRRLRRVRLLRHLLRHLRRRGPRRGGRRPYELHLQGPGRPLHARGRLP
ncbi:MAG: DnaJ domain-containing protein [Hyphomicrobium sp.]